MQEFPESNEEFGELLAELNLPSEDWLNTPYSREKIFQFAMLYAVWRSSHSAQGSSMLSRWSVDREKEEIDGGRRKRMSPFASALERVLDCGADPEDLARLVTEFQKETIGQFLYFLDDPGGMFRAPFSDELRFAIYTQDEDGNAIPGSDAQWRCFHEMLTSGYEVLSGKAYDE